MPKDFMKIKFDSDDDLPLNKPLKPTHVNNNCLTCFWRWWQILSTTLFGWVLVWIINILQYEKKFVFEGLDINKTSAWTECMLCQYWHFKDVGFKFELHVCNRCHDVNKNIAMLM